MSEILKPKKVIEKDSCKTLLTTKIWFENGHLESSIIQKKIFKGEPTLHFLILSKKLIHILKFSDPDSDEEGPVRAQFYETFRFNLETGDIFKVNATQSDFIYGWEINYFPENDKFSYEYREHKIFKISHTYQSIANQLPDFQQNLSSVKDVFPKKKDEVIQKDHFQTIQKNNF